VSGGKGAFEGRVAVITGAAGDLGSAAAVLMAEGGAQIVAVDRDPERLEGLRARLPIGAELLTLVADVTNETQVAAYVAATLERFGRIDVLFNNAGTEGSRSGAWRLIPDLSVEDFEHILSVNTVGVFLGLKHIIPIMAAAGRGAIVNTSSINGLKGSRGQVAYVASKHAVTAMTATAAKEWAHAGVRVNAIAPGAIAGRMLRDYVEIIQANSPPPVADEPTRYIPPPIAGWADPANVAAAAVFLASDEASYVTGACWSVDGGLIAL
jgi:NAD(P)-dependent dehydrogenase (short-subunit alcohol dehydrogenase family)